MKVWVVAGEYWHPNSAIYEGQVVAVCSTKELAEQVAADPGDGQSTHVYEHWLMEPEG